MAAAMALLFATALGEAQTAMLPYRNPKLPVEQRVEDLLKRMTLEEKVAMASGGGWMESKANDRLGMSVVPAGEVTKQIDAVYKAGVDVGYFKTMPSNDTVYAKPMK
jgi:hypothetical protein